MTQNETSFGKRLLAVILVSIMVLVMFTLSLIAMTLWGGVGFFIAGVLGWLAYSWGSSIYNHINGRGYQTRTGL